MNFEKIFKIFALLVFVFMCFALLFIFTFDLGSSVDKEFIPSTQEVQK